MTFKQRLKVMIPILSIGFLIVFFIPDSYTRHVGIATLCTYWITIMVWEQIHKKKQDALKEDNKKK